MQSAGRQTGWLLRSMSAAVGIREAVGDMIVVIVVRFRTAAHSPDAGGNYPAKRVHLAGDGGTEVGTVLAHFTEFLVTGTKETLSGACLEH